MHILIDVFKGCPEKVIGPECNTQQAGGIDSLVCAVKVVGVVKA